MRGGEYPAIANRTEEDNIFLSTPVSAPDGLVLSFTADIGIISAAAIFEPVYELLECRPAPMYERPGGSMNINERLANRGSTTHAAKLENACTAGERIGYMG